MSTKQRLLQEGMRLFASRGFEGTTVGDIEAAAGLRPRRGALYRHFPSKEALLAAAVEEYNAIARQAALDFTTAPAEDPRALALAVGRWVLARLDEQRDISHVLEREGHRLPALRDSFRAGTDAGFRAAGTVVEQWLQRRHPEVDADATGVLLLGGLVNFRRSTWTLGAAPLGLDDDRFLNGFATVFEILVGVRGPAQRPASPPRGTGSPGR